MNILLISHVFPPKRGGVQTAAYNTAKFLAKFGHNVVVLTSKWGKERRNYHKMDGFLVYRFKSFNPPEFKGIPQISSLRFMPKALFKIPKIIKKHNIQLIHIEGRLFPISYLSALLNLIIFKRPIFLSVQGRLQVGVTGIIEDLFDKIITNKIYQRLNKIICVSESLKQRLINFKIKENNIKVIPNGVDVNKFSRLKRSAFLDKYLVGKEDYKRIIFVGRLDVQKGVKYLIKAIPKVLKEYRKVHFFILGNGNLERYLKDLANELKIGSNITFIDFIPLGKMPNFYSAADIFCLPSLHEGFPLSIAEALSMGLIIVASDTEGIPEAIVESKNGFLVEPKNVNQLSEKLLKALNLNEIEIKKISENNRKLAVEKYSWENIVNEIVKTYKKAI
ncbi:MAG: glycosyltransferase family 4 protein [Promethearchaeota archaeon]